jgi:hypothetical protein
MHSSAGRQRHKTPLQYKKLNLKVIWHIFDGGFLVPRFKRLALFRKYYSHTNNLHADGK